MSKTPLGVRSSSPVLGADTDAVVADAGFSADEIAALRAEGIIA
jgi:formyl-CoA transferase